MSNPNQKKDGWSSLITWGAALIGAAAAGAAAATYFSIPEEESRHRANPGPSNKRAVKFGGCAICADTLEDPCKVFIEPCRHVYHKSCLEEWERVQGREKVKCPYCQSHYNATPAHRNQNIQSMNLDRCCVCLDDECDEVKIILDTCRHVFHRSCFAAINSDDSDECPKCKVHLHE